MKTLLTVLIVVILLVGGVTGLISYFGAKAAAAANEPTAVRVEPAIAGSLIEFISASGEIEPRTKVSISARVSARINELPFKEGDRVTKGSTTQPASVLVKLDSKELEAALKSVEARRSAEEASLKVSQGHVLAQRAKLDAIRVTLADAKRELERNKKLLESKDVSLSSVETLQSKVDSQEAEIASAYESLKAEESGLEVLKHNIEAASAEIDRARDNLSYTTISSPIDGVVTRLNAEVGELVVTGTMNNAGTMILEVADLSQMIVNARVDETSIADVEVGQHARVRVEAYRDTVFEGTVTNVALANFDAQFSRNSGSSNNRALDGGKYFKVEISLKTEGKRIFSGLSADVDIETHRYENIIKVPSQSVVGRSPDTLPPEVRTAKEVDLSKATIPVVYRLIDGKAVATPVTIGASDLTHTIIKSGLTGGDPIITGPYKVLEALAHDQKVKNDRATTAPTTTQPTTTQPTTPKPVTTSPATTRAAR